VLNLTFFLKCAAYKENKKQDTDKKFPHFLSLGVEQASALRRLSLSGAVFIAV